MGKDGYNEDYLGINGDDQRSRGEQRELWVIGDGYARGIRGGSGAKIIAPTRWRNDLPLVGDKRRRRRGGAASVTWRVQN